MKGGEAVEGGGVAEEGKLPQTSQRTAKVKMYSLLHQLA